MGQACAVPIVMHQLKLEHLWDFRVELVMRHKIVMHPMSLLGPHRPSRET